MTVNLMPIIVLESAQLAQSFPLAFRNFNDNIFLIPDTIICFVFAITGIVIQKLAFGFGRRFLFIQVVR
ncbi:MAG TPA: hypothetical protein DHG49_00150 [Clostridiales bacterium]|nr:hypothetical protein [Clostridiales bacterium]